MSDICIRAYEDGKQVYAEPGIALLPPNSAPVLGYAAQKVVRQQPTRIHSRFWADLSTSPLSITQTRMRHGADLIWHQLNQIRECLSSEEVIFCLSSHLGNAQMQLLAGICESLEMKAHFFLNKGLSQLAHREHLAPRVTHLDLQLHQLVLSRFTNENGQLELNSQETVPGISYMQLIDRMVHALRDQFIQVSRFDPLHSGDTEQQLFDQVANLITSSHLSPIEITTGSQTYRVEPTVKDFGHVIDILEEALEKLIPQQEQRAYSPIFSQLPGFSNYSESDLNLDSGDCIQGAETLIARQKDSVDGILYISAMETGSAEIEAPEAAQQPEDRNAGSTELANALVYGGIVYPASRFGELMELLNAPNGAVETNGKGISGSQAIQVNGQACIPGQLFSVRDEITVNQASLLAVQLLE